MTVPEETKVPSEVDASVPPVSVTSEPATGQRRLGPAVAIPHHPLALVLWGASYPWRALGFMQRHGLWMWASFAILVHVVLLLVVACGLWLWTVPWLALCNAHLVALAADSPGWQAAVTLAVWGLWAIVVPLILVLSLVVVLLVGQLLASPFLDLLSEQVECAVMGTSAAPAGVRRTLAALALAAADCVWAVLYLGMAYVPLLILSLVPGLGAGISLVAGALLVAQQFLGLVLSRQLISYRARWACVLGNRWSALGFGLMVTLMLAVPGINLLLLPLATVGGTLLTCALWQAGRLVPILPPPPGAALQVQAEAQAAQR
jgi:CysZ protein